MDKLKKINTEEIKKDLSEMKVKITDKIHHVSEDAGKKIKSIKEKIGKVDESKESKETK